jgi:lipopolysaccharide transport system ATP-binding protein
MSAVIEVDNLWKKYRLGIIGTGSLRHDFERWWHRVRGKPDPHSTVGETANLRTEVRDQKSDDGGQKPERGDQSLAAATAETDSSNGAAELGDDEMWALRGVSFEVKQGEILGIIGRNGAGKSTLLKILSRVTAPTSGEARVKGRIASLLEVGTGFHPELTGRENVFLNGAILGMTKTEIRKKFDEIVDFAGVERYMDTPVKRYSSGMYVRLAFAVAAHLDTEILICDEVLAVGDADFQKKCMGKMQDVSKRGRTILFVSHNMAAITKLCSQCAFLDGGRLKLIGATDEIIPHYLRGGKQTEGIRTWNETENSQDPRLKIHVLRIVAPDGTTTGHVDIRKPFTVEVEYQIFETLPQLRIALTIVTPDGTVAFTAADSGDPSYETKQNTPGHYTTRCFFPGDLLNEGFYSLTFHADIPFQKLLFLEEGAMGFSVEQTGGVSSRYPEKWLGVVCPRLKWQTLPFKTVTTIFAPQAELL